MIQIGFSFKAFKERFILEAYIDKKKVKFLELRQNDPLVADYKAQYKRFSKYILEVTTDELK